MELTHDRGDYKDNKAILQTQYIMQINAILKSQIKGV